MGDEVVVAAAVVLVRVSVTSPELAVVGLGVSIVEDDGGKDDTCVVEDLGIDWKVDGEVGVVVVC